MPFSLHLPTNHPHPTSCHLPNPKQPTPINQNPIFRRFSAFSSLRTSLDCVSDGRVEKGSSSSSSLPPPPIRLPFLVRTPARVSRFFWTGNCLQVAVSVDGGRAAAASGVDFDDRWLRACGSVVWDFFIPRGVTGNYVEYVKWKLLHRVFSSALQVLATQAMFTAMGVGFSCSLPSAAALNWVLKDGLGRLSRCIYTASLASAFDTNLKRVRFTTSVLFVASIGLELLTPAFPRCFLLLATIANISKQISLACYLATRSIGAAIALERPLAATETSVVGRIEVAAVASAIAPEQDGAIAGSTAVFNCYLDFKRKLANTLMPPLCRIVFDFPCAVVADLPYAISAVHQSFAIGDNLGEISAKAQIQTVCFDILGLMLAALVNLWIENHRRQQAGFHYFIYPFFAAMDLFGIYQGLKTVHLQTLTKDRLEIILSTWIECGYVPSPAEVSEKEGINFLGVKGGKCLWPIRIGCLNPKDQIPKWSMKTIQCITDEDYYFVCVEIFEGLKRIGKPSILLSIREGAEAVHIIMGMLQACYIRRALLMNNTRWEIIIEESHASDSTMEDWFVIVEDAKKSAERDTSNLIEQMVGKGWMAKNILLSTQEQTRYSFICD
ncbi:Protein root UVB sensitive 4 [Glycine max]|nr:Protein root UVB sensitive 4 [Glycine max]